MAPTKQTLKVDIAAIDVEVGKSIQSLLKTQRIESRIFGAGRELLAGVKLSAPDCVVTAAELPDFGGVELLKRLRKAGFNIPVIVLAGHSAAYQAVEAIKSGAWDYVEMPFAHPVLLDSVKKAVASPRP